jgi:hypothetical protein
MPLSADFPRALQGPVGRSMYADFRPDVDWPGQYGVSYRTIATNIVAQVLERDLPCPWSARSRTTTIRIGTQATPSLSGCG